MIKNEQLKKSILEIVKVIPFARFTGRVSYEVFGVLEPSLKKPHDIDIVVPSFSDLKGICETTIDVNPSTGYEKEMFYLKLETGVPTDIYQQDALEKRTDIYKTVLIDGVSVMVAHPFYATKAKVQYVTEGRSISYGANWVVRQRLAKHRNHVKAYYEWISLNPCDDLPSEKMLKGDFVDSGEFLPF